jgi:preprotein translocase SecE subunit
MARPTRQQRRARRAQQEPALVGGPPARPPVRPTANAEPAPERRPPRAAEPRRAPGSGVIRFIQESWGELKKVEWPDQKAVISGTAVVVIACIIVGAFLWLNDEVWKYVVKHVLLR